MTLYTAVHHLLPFVRFLRRCNLHAAPFTAVFDFPIAQYSFLTLFLKDERGEAREDTYTLLGRRGMERGVCVLVP